MNDAIIEPPTTTEKPISKKDSAAKEDVGIVQTPVVALPTINPDAGGTLGPEMSPVMQEMQGIQAPVNEEIFEEIPVEVCGQMYQTVLEVGYTLKNKGMPMRELPEARVNTQAAIIYGIMKKNQINIKHIDLFMLAAGMMADYKYMGTYAEEQKNEDAYRGSSKENDTGEYGEIDGQ